MKSKLAALVAVILAALLTVVGLAASSSAAPVPTDSSLTPVPLTRVVNVPGEAISIGQTKVVPVAGRTFANGVKIPADATAVVGRLVAYQTAKGESLVAWDGVRGMPGDATVNSGPTTTAHAGPSEAFTSSLTNGALSVGAITGAGSFLLEVNAYVTPNAPVPAAPLVLHGQQAAATTAAGSADPTGIVLTHVGGTIVGNATLLSTIGKVPAGHYDVSALVTDFREPGTSSTAPAGVDTVPTVVIVAGDQVDAGFSNVLATLQGPAIPKMTTASGDVESGIDLNSNITVPADGDVSVLSFAANTDRSGYGTAGQDGAGAFSSALQSFTLESTS